MLLKVFSLQECYECKTNDGVKKRLNYHVNHDRRRILQFPFLFDPLSIVAILRARVAVADVLLRKNGYKLKRAHCQLLPSNINRSSNRVSRNLTWSRDKMNLKMTLQLEISIKFGAITLALRSIWQSNARKKIILTRFLKWWLLK